jgi:hypothetical protein
MNQNMRSLNEKRIKNAQFNLRKPQYLHYGTHSYDMGGVP